jgi:hypothetical protein
MVVRIRDGSETFSSESDPVQSACADEASNAIEAMPSRRTTSRMRDLPALTVDIPGSLMVESGLSTRKEIRQSVFLQ